MALKWRKGEDPRLDRMIETALRKDDVKRGDTTARNALGSSYEQALAAANARALAGSTVDKNGRRKWSNAEPTVGKDGIKYPSKMEARVADRLRAALSPGERLVRQPSFPLLALEPGKDGKVARFTPDFAIVRMSEPDDLPGWTALSAETWRQDPEPTTCHDGVERRMHRSDERFVWLRFVEAKGRRRSRDYALRRDAFAATYGPILSLIHI